MESSSIENSAQFFCHHCRPQADRVAILSHLEAKCTVLNELNTHNVSFFRVAISSILNSHKEDDDLDDVNVEAFVDSLVHSGNDHKEDNREPYGNDNK